MTEMTERQIELTNKIDAVFDAANKRIEELLALLND